MSDILVARVMIDHFLVILTTLVLLTFSTQSPSGQKTFPLIPGGVITGPIARKDGSLVDFVHTGADANTYLRLGPPSAPFLGAAKANIVVTNEPVQYTRVYTRGVSNPAGNWLAGSNAIRGRTPPQIKDTLALPYMPTDVAIVQVPAGTCLMTGTAAAIETWGNGGAWQSYVIGTSNASDCSDAQSLPVSAYTDQQPLGGQALAYAEHAENSNIAVVAGALDHAAPPPLFSDMDNIYNILDSLNVASRRSLNYALQQLDGEIYANVATAVINPGQLFLTRFSEQRGLQGAIGETRPWAMLLGGSGSQAGHSTGIQDVFFHFNGLAAGLDYQINAWQQAGLGFGYTAGKFSTQGVSGTGKNQNFHIVSYLTYMPGAWYFTGAAGYSWSDVIVTRDIIFSSQYAGIARRASGSFGVNSFFTRAETGYHYPFNDAVILTPFVGLQSALLDQGHFTENGAGALNLHINGNANTYSQSVLGSEITCLISAGLYEPLRLNARFGWGHELLNRNRNITASLEGLPDRVFIVNGAAVPRDSAMIAIDTLLPLLSGNVSLHYAGSASSGYRIHTGSITIGWAF